MKCKCEERHFVCTGIGIVKAIIINIVSYKVLSLPYTCEDNIEEIGFDVLTYVLKKRKVKENEEEYILEVWL